MTMDQERPSFPVPGKDALFFKQIGIDLGSRYAAQLGFDGIEAYHDESLGAETANKKKKKRKKKKKGHGGDEDGESNHDHDDGD
jgi:hypothetical protein